MQNDKRKQIWRCAKNRINGSRPTKEYRIITAMQHKDG